MRDLAATTSFPRASDRETISGVLTIKWYPVRDPGSGEIVPGFALRARKEKGAVVPSSHTLGQVLAALAQNQRAWLGPAPGMIRPPNVPVFMGSFCGWVVATCIRYVIESCARVQPPGRPLQAAVIDDETEKMVNAYASAGGKCELRQEHFRLPLKSAEHFLGVPWYASLETLMRAYESRKMGLNPNAAPDEQELEYQSGLLWLHASMLRVMVQRVRDGRFAVPLEWRVLAERWGDRFQKGRGRPPGPGTVKLPVPDTKKLGPKSDE